jgi:two-component sensor histidine kinase
MFGGRIALVQSILMAKWVACLSSAEMSPRAHGKGSAEPHQSGAKASRQNTLAVLCAMATQTFRDASSKSDLEKVSSDLLRLDERRTFSRQQIGLEAPLPDVINTALAPYKTDERRYGLGTSLVVKSRQALALSLAIHELATNALKYGALSVAGGHVSVTGELRIMRRQSLFSSGRNMTARMPRNPPVSGFGSRLISRVLQEDFQRLRRSDV